MIHHLSLGNKAFSRSKKLKELIKAGDIIFAGNKRLKIYGLLNCRSGKRMKTENRVFFASEEEAVSNAFRPCGTCLPQAYSIWKANNPFNHYILQKLLPSPCLKLLKWSLLFLSRNSFHGY